MNAEQHEWYWRGYNDAKKRERREFVGLMDEEMQKASEGLTEYEWFIHGAFWAEAKLKEKNT